MARKSRKQKYKEEFSSIENQKFIIECWGKQLSIPGSVAPVSGVLETAIPENFAETSSNLLPNLETMVSSMQRKTGWDIRE